MNPLMVYLDTSLGLYTITDVPHQKVVLNWMQSLEHPIVSSRLFQTEVIRAMRRDKRPLSEAAPLLDRVQLLQISEHALIHAETIETHTKALDAIHLGTALTLKYNILFATHDKRMKTIANDLGFTVIDPLESI